MRRFDRTLQSAIAVIATLVFAVVMTSLPLEPALASIVLHHAGRAGDADAAPCHGMASGKAEQGVAARLSGPEYHRDCCCNRDDCQNASLFFWHHHPLHLSAIANRIFPAPAVISDSQASGPANAYTSLTHPPALRPPIL